MSVNKHPLSSFSSSSSTRSATNQQPSLSTSSSTAGQRLFNGVPVNTLYDFMHRDIQPEGPRVLLNFLATTDRLRLSVCSKGLLKYRSHLTDIKISSHSSPAEPTNKEDAPAAGGGVSDSSLGALARLLFLQDGKVQRLHIRDASMFKVLHLGAMGCFKGLKSVRLECDDMTNAVASCAGGGLSGGGFDDLEDVQLSCTCVEDGMGHIYLALRYCPNLRRLSLLGSHVSQRDDGSLGHALKERACPNLEELALAAGMETTSTMRALKAASCLKLSKLVLERTVTSGEAAWALADAIWEGRLPRLRHLDLSQALRDRNSTRDLLAGLTALRSTLGVLLMSNNDFDQEHGQVLWEALRGGGYPRLLKLDLAFNKSLGDKGVVPVAEALRDGSCRNLGLLWLSEVGMGPTGCSALAQAVKFKALPNLQHLSLNHNERIGDQAIAELLTALAQPGNCPKLRTLSARSTGLVGDATHEPLLSLFEQRACPRLEVLDVPSSCPLDDVKLLRLANLFKDGAGASLTKVTLSCSRQEAVPGFVEVFKLGACPRLKRLNIYLEWFNDDYGLNELQREIGRRGIYLHYALICLGSF